jgi:cytochrome c oxidase subunit 3
MVSVGTIVWLSSELMFFAALFAMYFTIRSVSGPEVWAEGTEFLTVGYASVFTIILVASSATCQLGVFAAERGDVYGLRRWYVITLIMGAIFVGGQANEYRHLVHEGLTIASSGYGSVFYLTTGFHGLHVIGGLFAFVIVLMRSTIGRFTPGEGDQRHRHVLLLALRRRGLDRPVRDDLHHPVTDPRPTGKPRRDLLPRPRRTGAPPQALSGSAVIALALGVVGLGYTAVGAPQSAAQEEPAAAQSLAIREGRRSTTSAAPPATA